MLNQLILRQSFLIFLQFKIKIKKIRWRDFIHVKELNFYTAKVLAREKFYFIKTLFWKRILFYNWMF